MAKVYILCGKICCGKSYYANKIKSEKNAVVLNIDELTYYLFDNRKGENYIELTQRATNYFKNKAVEIVKVGINVILDIGLWTKEDRDKIREFFDNQQIENEIHYIHVSDEIWKKNIENRNARIKLGNQGYDFFVTDTLKQKVCDLWEEPENEEFKFLYDVKY